MTNETLGPADKIINTILAYTGHLFHGRPGIVVPDTTAVTGVKWSPVTHKVEDGKKIVYRLDKVRGKSVKTRIGEILSRIGSGSTKFSELPTGIRDASVFGVVTALDFQRSLLPKRDIDPIQFFQKNANAVASTAVSPYKISELAFGWTTANIKPDTIEEVLRSFKIDGGWPAIQSIARRCNLGVLPLKEAFKISCERRHMAAHQANAITEATELENFMIEALAIAIGIDLLLSRALRLLIDADSNYLSNKQKLPANSIKIRILEQRADNKWHDKLEGNIRATEVSGDFNNLLRAARTRAKERSEAVVVLGPRSLPMRWYTPYVD